MVKNIVDGVCKALNLYVNKNKKFNIYCEEVRQGVKIPCFFVYCINYNNELFRGKRYRVKAEIEVKFYSETKSQLKKLNIGEITEKIFDACDVIDCENGLLRGFNKKFEVNEDGFTFNVSYEFFYYKTEEVENMEDLEHKEVVNNDN